MRIFGSEKLDSMLSKLGMKEGESIAHPWVNKALERAQSKVEARNFDIRKNILKYDDVMNEQRKAIFSQRRDIMDAEDLSEIVSDMRYDVIDDLVLSHISKDEYPEQWKISELDHELKSGLALALPLKDWIKEDGIDPEIISSRIAEASDRHMAQKVGLYGPEVMRKIEKQVVLQTIDKGWQDHLLTLEHLRTVVSFRGYAQKDPLNEYKSEAFALFDNLLQRLRGQVTRFISFVQVVESENSSVSSPTSVLNNNGKRLDKENWGRVSRNATCPCGSGKKYKHCHGRN